MFEPLPQPKTLTILPTQQCTAECEHCGTLSSPRERTRLERHQIFSVIDQAVQGGYAVVVFSGGEPTLIGKDLLEAIRWAHNLGLSTRVVTNAYWATSDKAASAKVAQLAEAGLDEINFSTGDQHTRFVPIENVIRAARHSVASGLPVSIMVESVKERAVTQQTLEDHPDFIALLREFPGPRINIDESPWMPLVPDQVNTYLDGMLINEDNVGFQSGCESVLSMVAVQPNGDIGACCGIGMAQIPELQIGNITNTTLAAAMEKASDDFLKQWIRIEGPEKILAWAAGYDAEIEWQHMYAHRCQACKRLYSDERVREVIRAHHQEKLADVLFGEWVLFQYPLEQAAPGEDLE